jgi:hypothetical protein
MMARKPNLRALLARCKRTLALNDWDIRIRYMPHDQIADLCHSGPDDYAEGCLITVIGKREADIYVCDPATYPHDATRPQNIRRTVWHECLHILLLPMSSKRSEVAEDQIVHALATALTRKKPA